MCEHLFYIYSDPLLCFSVKQILMQKNILKFFKAIAILKDVKELYEDLFSLTGSISHKLQ